MPISAFESEKNKKAALYTAIICGTLLLLFFLISWRVEPPTVPVIQDLIEINLGNDEEGFGDVQPLVKGDRSPAQETVIVPARPQPSAASDDVVEPDDNAEADAAPVNKPVKNAPKIKTDKTPVPAVAPTPKPQKPKLVYDGPGKEGGNNPTTDNGYRYEGNKKDGIGDNGSPTGDKDSYGNTPGGKTGGARVINGNRKIIRHYAFTGELPKATIYAMIKVAPSGQGTLVRLVKPSTSFNQGYATSISNYLRNMQFDKANDESTVTVQFNFNVN